MLRKDVIRFASQQDQSVDKVENIKFLGILFKLESLRQGDNSKLYLSKETGLLIFMTSDPPNEESCISICLPKPFIHINDHIWEILDIL